MFRYITKTVWLLSAISLFADLASEMLYPVLPAFLDGIGMTAAGIGLLEGAAALVAGFGKAWFGSLSDQLQRRNLFVLLGYGLSAVAKPVMGLLPTLGPVFAARLSDRVGKGMRGGARDALLTAEAPPEHRGKVFGFHRSMDTVGAVLGAAVALAWILAWPTQLDDLFLVAAIPGLLSILFALLLPREPVIPSKGIKPFKGIFRFWGASSQDYRRILLGGVLFALLNSSDILLLLKAGESGLSLEAVIGLYLIYNVVYVLASYPLGGLADKIGFKPVYIASVLVYGVSYLAMGWASGWWEHAAVFAVYGCFTAANEGVTKAWLSLHCGKEQKATAIGLFDFSETLAKFVASPLLGLIWVAVSPAWAFGGVGVAALLLAVALIAVLPRPRS